MNYSEGRAMGAWGTGLFENDAACDLASDVAEGDPARLEQAIDAVLACGAGYLEAPVAEECLAAAAIIARLKSGPERGTKYPEVLEPWFRSAAAPLPAGLDQKAKRAIQRVLSETRDSSSATGILDLIKRALRREQSGPSEILKVWSDSTDFEEWRRNVDAVRARL
ncbi:DUF4259 domain-containing protein [Chthonobacter albigriseus]|uniref:DUF4259 domain-containing protein n=1 Tax=Chthonobacter albigriseus TaxID=1683161 RepID=UPI0015EE8BC1